MVQNSLRKFLGVHVLTRQNEHEITIDTITFDHSTINTHQLKCTVTGVNCGMATHGKAGCLPIVIAGRLLARLHHRWRVVWIPVNNVSPEKSDKTEVRSKMRQTNSAP